MAKFFRRSKSKLYFLTTVASVAAPTIAEIDAGIDLSPSTAEINNFEYTGSRIPVPNLSDSFTPQITGEDTVGDANIVCYDDDASTVIRAGVDKGTAGYIVRAPYGKVATKRCEVWPVTSQGINDEWTVANEPARFTIQLAVTDVPNVDAVITA